MSPRLMGALVLGAWFASVPAIGAPYLRIVGEVRSTFVVPADPAVPDPGSSLDITEPVGPLARSLSIQGSDGGGSASGGVTLSADYGLLGVSGGAGAGGPPPLTGGVPAAGTGFSQAIFSDSITITPVNPGLLFTVGQFSWEVEVSGSGGVTGTAAVGDGFGFAEYSVGVVVGACGLNCTFTRQGSWQRGLAAFQGDPLPVAISGTSSFSFGSAFTLTVQLAANAGASVSSGSGSMSAFSDLSQTLRWNGILSVTDGDGRPVAFQVTSASGTDWSVPHPMPVPEPATWVSLLAGLGLLASVLPASVRRRVSGRGRSSAFGLQPSSGNRALGTLCHLALVPCLGLCLEAGAADVFVNRITTNAQVERSERANGPGAVLTLVDQDIAGGVDIDAYARLDDDNTAYQSYSGFNAVRVQALIDNAYPQNNLTATTFYSMSVTTVGDTAQALYLDYLVFPGVVGLQGFGSVGERARVSFDVSVLTPGLTYGMPTGAQGQVMLERVQRGAGVATVSTIDPVFLNAGAFTQGGAEVSGTRVNTIETQPFLATAFLGAFEPLEVVEIAYRMSASITIPGYETAAIARLGDPFSLRADTQAEIDKYFAGSPTPFRVRAEPVTPVPEPGAWLMLLSGLAALASHRATRRRARATVSPRGGR